MHISPSSAPIKRLKEEAREAGLLVDVTQGRKTRAILIMDSRHVIMSAKQPETITGRFLKVRKAKKKNNERQALYSFRTGRSRQRDCTQKGL